MNPSNTNTTKPIILQGHSRPIKDITFSVTGEQIFTASNDRNVISWISGTGEKMKTYPHSAAVNIVLLTRDGKYMVTGDNTGCVYLWDAEALLLLKRIEQDPTFCVRSIHLSSDDTCLMVLYAGRMKGAKSFIAVYRLQDIIDYQGEEEEEKQEKEKSQLSNVSGLIKMNKDSKQAAANNTIVITETNTKVVPFKTFECTAKDTKYMQAKFAIMNKSVIASREDGFLELINFTNGKILTESKFHSDIILDFDINTEIGLILTASRDGTACVINFDTFQILNKFHPQNPTRNLNACKLAVIKNPEYNVNTTVNSIQDVNSLFESNFNIKPKEMVKIDVDNIFGSGSDTLTITPTKTKKEIIVAIISGGQDSKLVTTTNQKEGGFEILIYDALEGNELANFLTHFGPVNSLAVSRNILASGAEDATVRLYKLENYLFQIDKNK